MRIILYLGKGGVGKTTVAAATALRSAELGHKTLVASTDIAHSLADSLDAQLSDKPTEIVPNLWAQEISVVADIYNYWDTLQEFASSVIAGQGLNRVVADELSAFPGMDEIVSLLHINKQAKERNFDRVIIDAAPTGETIRDHARHISLVRRPFVSPGARGGRSIAAICRAYIAGTGGSDGGVAQAR